MGRKGPPIFIPVFTHEEADVNSRKAAEPHLAELGLGARLSGFGVYASNRGAIYNFSVHRGTVGLDDSGQCPRDRQGATPRGTRQGLSRNGLPAGEFVNNLMGEPHTHIYTHREMTENIGLTIHEFNCH